MQTLARDFFRLLSCYTLFMKHWLCAAAAGRGCLQCSSWYAKVISCFWHCV